MESHFFANEADLSKTAGLMWSHPVWALSDGDYALKEGLALTSWCEIKMLFTFSGVIKASLGCIFKDQFPNI